MIVGSKESPWVKYKDKIRAELWHFCNIAKSRWF